MLCAHAAGADLRQCRVDLAEAVEEQVGAGLGQAQGDAQADAAGGTGDQGGLAFRVMLFLPLDEKRADQTRPVA
ncbi:hypothetical protein P4193_26865 [Pseudomonas aeruginosa]|nr:hypothetical protein [Pseudomonas aeruginosa]